MSAENEQILRRAIQAWNDSDWEVMSAAYHPDARVEAPEGWPQAQTSEGWPAFHLDRHAAFAAAGFEDAP